MLFTSLSTTELSLYIYAFAMAIACCAFLYCIRIFLGLVLWSVHNIQHAGALKKDGG